MPWRLGVRAPAFAWFVPGHTAVNVVRSDSSRAPTLIEMRELKHVDPETLRTLPFRHFEGMPHEVPFEIRPELHWAVNQQRRALGLPPLGESWSHPTTRDPGGRRDPQALTPPVPMPLHCHRRPLSGRRTVDPQRSGRTPFQGPAVCPNPALRRG